MWPPPYATRFFIKLAGDRMEKMELFIEKGGRRLRLGYTTGSCAAAAAKAAAWMLLSGRRKETVSLLTPKGIGLRLAVREIAMGKDEVCCAVVKDGGDDPDATDGALIFACVSKTVETGILIDGGTGIGRVTRPGLDQPPGAAAINSVPRRMILENVREVCRLFDYTGGLSVIISAPQGEALAAKTFNPRLGIEGGISILGTTGIVEPMSEQALVDTLRVELRQRRTAGAGYILLTPGNYGAAFIKDALGLCPETAVMTSNYIGDALDICRQLGFAGVLLVGHIGKLVKLAGGMFNTHSKYGDCRMDILAAQAAACGLGPEGAARVLESVSCDDALRILQKEAVYEETLRRLTRRIGRMMALKADGMQAGAVLFSKVWGPLGETDNARALLQKIKEE